MSNHHQPDHLPNNPIRKASKSQMDPFLVFSAHKRMEIVYSNPTLPASTITSILSSMWRKLDKEQKAHYSQISLELEGIPISYSRKNTYCASKSEDNMFIKPENDRVPSIHIVPRCDFGRSISEISIELARSIEKGS